MHEYLTLYQVCYSKQFKWPSVSQVLCYFPPLNVFAGQSPTFPNIKPIKIYTFRILYT